MGLIKSIKKLFTKKGSKKSKHAERGALADDLADPLADPLIGGPTDVQRTPQPLQEFAKKLGNDPAIARMLRFEGDVLKLDTSSLRQPEGQEGADPEAPANGLPPLEQVLDVSRLPPPKPFWEHTGTDGANGYVRPATTKDGQAVVVKRPYIVPGESRREPPAVFPIAGDVDRTLAARMLAGPEVRPNMLEILSAGTGTTTYNHDGVAHAVNEPMLVMGALNETLDKRMADGGALSPKDTERHGATLLKVIAALQRAGLTHNDLKSDNLMFNGADELVLIDFGELTSADGVFEQATGAQSTWSPNYQRETGAKKDSWAAGLNLLAMMRGQKTVDLGADLSQCTSQEEVDAKLDELFATTEQDEGGANDRVQSSIRGLLRYDEAERWDAQTALGQLEPAA